MKYLLLLLLYIPMASLAQSLPSKDPIPLDINLKSFPALQILQTINNLQADLKACEQTNAAIIAQTTKANQQLTQVLTNTQGKLAASQVQSDSLHNQLRAVSNMATLANTNIKKARWKAWTERLSITLISAFIGFSIKAIN